MTIILYANNSDMIEVNKNITPISLELTGYLRDGCSVTDPAIEVEWDTTILNANYLYIAEFKRYYYINGVTSIRNGLWLLSCHVDVLYTYREQIKNHSAIIARQENSYNLYLPDDRFIINSDRLTVTKDFPNKLPPSSNPNSKYVILTLLGGYGEQSSE